MEPQIDIFWLLVAGIVTAVVRGLYRRIRNFPAFAWKFTNVSYICNAKLFLNIGDYIAPNCGHFLCLEVIYRRLPFLFYFSDRRLMKEFSDTGNGSRLFSA